MQASSRLLAPGFTRRSIDEFKRYAKIGAYIEVEPPYPVGNSLMLRVYH